MTMQPKLKANELMERVNAFRKSSDKNDLTRQALYRDINKLKKNDPGKKKPAPILKPVK